MKNLTLIALLLFAVGLIGCTSMGFDYSEDELKKAVEFETGCSQDEVEILDAMDGGTGHTKFKVDACGENQRWNRMGTSYFLEGKGPVD